MILSEIIVEELVKFIREYFDPEEQSLIDKYHAAKGIHTVPAEAQASGEFVGNVTTTWGKQRNDPIPVYRNPSDLSNYPPDTRGILLQNGDVFLGAHPDALHDDMLDVLTKRNIVPRASIIDWTDNHPEEFAAIQRLGNSNIFGSSASYSSFPHAPNVYIEHFDNANAKHSYSFKHA